MFYKRPRGKTRTPIKEAMHGWAHVIFKNGEMGMESRKLIPQNVNVEGMFTAKGVVALIEAIEKRFKEEEARTEKGGKVVVRILQEWENITKEVESKEDEFLSIRIQLNQGLTKTDKTLLKAIRLYMIETVEESNVLVRRGAKEEEFNFATWKLIERRMRKEEKELREWR